MIKEDITTCMVDLPTSIKSYVVAMLDNRFCIVLNQNGLRIACSCLPT